MNDVAALFVAIMVTILAVVGLVLSAFVVGEASADLKARGILKLNGLVSYYARQHLRTEQLRLGAHLFLLVIALLIFHDAVDDLRLDAADRAVVLMFVQVMLMLGSRLSLQTSSELRKSLEDEPPDGPRRRRTDQPIGGGA